MSLKKTSLIIFICSLIYSCSDNTALDKFLSFSQNSKKESNSYIDTTQPILQTSFKGKAFPEIFEAAFQPNTKATQGEMHYSFSVFDIGHLRIESGKIIACDPIEMKTHQPFIQNFPQGDFPVQLAMANDRVAYARIVFSEEPVVKWESALRPGQKALALQNARNNCNYISHGTEIYLDEKTSQAFQAKGKDEFAYIFGYKLELSDYKGLIYTFDKGSIAIFATGYGGDCYASYIGYDAQNRICRLISDFGFINWWKLKEHSY